MYIGIHAQIQHFLITHSKQSKFRGFCEPDFNKKGGNRISCLFTNGMYFNGVKEHTSFSAIDQAKPAGLRTWPDKRHVQITVIRCGGANSLSCLQIASFRKEPYCHCP
jgi:hypothetical protein